METFDVVVIGGGPGGSSAATFLSDGGLRVALFERERFPRFHVGESLMPATMLLLEELGAKSAIEERGFQLKYGASFYDEENGHTQTFYFLPGMPWPNYSYQVPRAEFDAVLLEHAKKRGVTVYQPAAVTATDFDAGGVTVTADGEGRPLSARAAMLVDATGRDAFIAARYGRRRRIPNLGKVALFAHYKGAARQTGLEEGNIRIYVFREGWIWWIPLPDDVTSVGTVCHARTTREWTGKLEGLHDAMIAKSPGVSAALRGGARMTPVHTEANFAYDNSPVVGDRFVAVGDAIAFVDPIFSGGVYIALRTGRLAATSILEAFRAGDLSARRFAGYERRVRTGLEPLFKFIHKYYEPSFFDLFMRPSNALGIYEAVLNVLSGGNWVMQPRRLRVALRIMYAIARIKGWVRRRAGLPVESRLEW
ncbi:MAG TPA: NAD(P)/FAD-dependent oxidoreductase [Methylomirabilota bacterium]|jgi:flavin-dependent dehydrogenase|nr:NAD(P)/FAD-dependent oxidoreductase [Methylomirabilota bacterium]